MEPYLALEAEFGTWLGVPHVVVVSSGTAALHVSLEALQLPPGSEVLCPEFTMIATARAITLAGLTPAFIDCDDRLLIDLGQADEYCAHARGNVRAVMPVHIYGRRVDATALASLAAKYDLRVVEDCAECPTPYPGGKHPSEASAFSFFRNKVIGSQEGGAIAFKNPAHAKLARQLRNLGFTDKHDFIHLPRGMNYRLANALASLVLDSLRHVEDNLRERRQIEAWYDAACPDGWRMPPRDVVWVYDLRLPGMSHEVQDNLVKRLQEAGVAARHSFKPCAWQEEYAPRWGVEFDRLNWRAARASAEVIYLPVTPGIISEADARLAFDVIRRIIM